jgi:hypothetical protein
MLRNSKRHHQTLTKGNLSFVLTKLTTNNGLGWNMAGNFGINYDFNYKRAVVWDNKFILAYGLSKIKDSKTAKTDDRLELNFCKKSKWRLVLFYVFNFKTDGHRL